MRIWKRLLGTALCLCAAVCVMSVSASAAEHSNHPICGKTHTDIGDHVGDCNNVIWTEVTQDNVLSDGRLTLAGGGSYYLGTNIAISKCITITGTVNLCLNGKTLSRSSTVIEVKGNATLNICDCQGGGIITPTESTYAAIEVTPSSDKTATLNLYGGEVSGSVCDSIFDESIIKLGSSYVGSKAVFNMYGGKVQNLNINNSCSAVYVTSDNACQINIYGGEVTCDEGDGIKAWNSGDAPVLIAGGTVTGGNAALSVLGNLTLSGRPTLKHTNEGGADVRITTTNVAETENDHITVSDDFAPAEETKVSVRKSVDRSGSVVFAAPAESKSLSSKAQHFVSAKEGYFVECADGVNLQLTACAITKQPAVNDYTVTANGGAKATYQWYSVTKGDVPVTSKNATTKDFSSDGDVGEWSCFRRAENGDLVSLGAFTLHMNAGDKLTLTEARGVDSFSLADSNNNPVSPDKSSWMSCTYTAPADGEYTLTVTARPESFDENNYYLRPSFKATVTADVPDTALTGQVNAALNTSQLETGSYICQVTWENKTTLNSQTVRYDAASSHVHSWSKEWKSDTTHHWHDCENANCDVTENSAKDGYAAHSGGTANCTQQAVCTICGTAYGDLDANGHDWDEPSYAWNGTSCTAERVCSRDGSHKETETVTAAVTVTQNRNCLLDELSTYTASFENAAFAKQTQENVVTANKLGHDFENGTWQSDGDYHWKKCSRCDVTDTKTAHRWNEGRETKSPTCTTAGEKTYICTDCGRTKTEQIDALGHDWGEWVVTKPATTSAAGEETRTCKRDASHTETHDIPKLTPAPSGGGSSSGSSSAPAITVPVSGSGDTVHVSASVSGSTAEVKEIKSAELDKIGTDSAVVIDLSGLNKGVTGVTLSTDTIDSICKTEADGVTVKLPSAELRVDRQTLAAVTEQAAGSKIRLVVEPDGTARSTMTAAQRSALDGMRNAAVLEAYFVSDGTRIHDFKGGSVELSIPYRADGAIRAWFLKEDGTREPVSARYDKENAQLILHHFSHYVIEELDSSAAYTVCAKDDSCPLGAFGDLTAAAWYHDGVHYCLENGLMRGVSGGKFLPDGSTTRAQLVTVLWRLEGSPETTGAVRFGDTAGGAWYTEAVRWAAGCGVVKGYDNGCFGPNDAVTREQMVTILYRYAQHKGYDVSAGEDTNILSFDDAFAVSEYAIPAMQWACGSGMVRGIAQKGGMLLAPRDTTTRAQAATLIMRFQSAFAKEP
uniref:S-layer homology domain-containing protein n=1 Tax=Angelakisella sp. TaxID=1935177 RepID=UPI004025CBCB